VVIDRRLVRRHHQLMLIVVHPYQLHPHRLILGQVKRCERFRVREGERAGRIDHLDGVAVVTSY
jgi:hypothetical protein